MARLDIPIYGLDKSFRKKYYNIIYIQNIINEQHLKVDRVVDLLEPRSIIFNKQYWLNLSVNKVIVQRRGNIYKSTGLNIYKK